MSVAGVLHMDNNGFPLCAGSRMPDFNVMQWREHHLWHVQVIAHKQQEILVNQYVDKFTKDDAELTEQCKNGPPGEPCCDLLWELSDPSIVALFGTRSKEVERALEKARHIPLHDFIARIYEARNAPGNHNEVELAIKIWNTGECGSSLSARANHQEPHDSSGYANGAKVQVRGMNKQHSLLKKADRERKAVKMKESILDLNNEYGDTWFPKKFRPTSKDRDSPATQPRNNHAISNIRTVIGMAKVYDVSPEALWEPNGLLFRSCGGRTFGPEEAKNALKQAREKYPEPNFVPRLDDREHSHTTMGDRTQCSANRLHLSSGQSDEAFHKAGKRSSSEAIQGRYDTTKSHSTQSGSQGNAQPLDSASVVVLDDSGSDKPHVQADDGLDAHLRSPTEKWNDKALYEGLEILCKPVAASHGYHCLDPLWFERANIPEKLPRPCYDGTQLKRLLVPLWWPLKPPSPSEEKPPGHWCLAVVTTSQETKHTIVELYDSLKGTGTPAAHDLTAWLQEQIETTVSLHEKPCMQQVDAHSCGPLVLLFAYRLLNGQSLEEPIADPRGEVQRLVRQARNQDEHAVRKETEMDTSKSTSPSSLFSADISMELDGNVSWTEGAPPARRRDEVINRYDTQRVELLETLSDVDIDGMLHDIHHQLTEKSQLLKRTIGKAQSIESELGTLTENMESEKKLFDSIQQLASETSSSSSTDGLWANISSQLSIVCHENKEAFEQRCLSMEEHAVELRLRIQREDDVEDQVRHEVEQLTAQKQRFTSMKLVRDILLAEEQ